MKKSTIFLIVFINLLLILGQLVLSAKSATDGDQLNKINQESARVREENKSLRNSIYEQSSLEVISAQATNLQLAKVTAQFMNLGQPVAQAK
jgi:regulatory protein YycI of two-component signal transduction system YycFG